MTAWVVANLLLIFVAGVPMWLASIGNLVGAAVIGRYALAPPEAPLTRAEKALRMGAYVVLGAIAALFALLLVVTILAFLVAWVAN
jgi:hypothetical protein